MKLGRTTRGSLYVLGTLLVGGGCAHVEAPAGGPEDRTPPRLLATRPDSLVVAPNLRTPVVFAFDERISEQQVRELVSVSPRTSPLAVDHRGGELRVSLRGGWLPNTIYHVAVAPGIADLFGNRTTEPLRLVFSTGGEIPDTRLDGEVIDRITGRPEADVRVEAIRAPDSLVYAVATGPEGRFAFDRIPEGEYTVRAFRDLNRNRSLEEFEPRDTSEVTVAVDAPASVALAILMPDTTPPVIASVNDRGERIEIRTDDHLDPLQELQLDQVEIVGPDGLALPVDSVALDTQPAPGDETPLPTQLIVVTLPEGTTLTAGERYVARLRGIRNINGVVGESELAWLAAPDP